MRGIIASFGMAKHFKSDIYCNEHYHHTGPTYSLASYILLGAVSQSPLRTRPGYNLDFSAPHCLIMASFQVFIALIISIADCTLKLKRILFNRSGNAINCRRLFQSLLTTLDHLLQKSLQFSSYASAIFTAQLTFSSNLSTHSIKSL